MNRISILITVWLLTALPVSAAPPKLWEYPGLYPLDSSPQALEMAGRELSRKSDLPETEFKRGVAMFESNDPGCKEVQLKDGYVMYMSYSNWGKTYVNKIIVALKHKVTDLSKGEIAGQSLPENHPQRKAKVCDLGRGDGAVVVYPYVCGNWSVMYQTIEISQPQPPQVIVAPRVIQFTGAVQEDVVQYSPAVTIKNCCINCESIHIQESITIIRDGGDLKSTGSAEVSW